MSVVEILKLIAEGGALVLLAAVLFGIFYVLIKLGPQALAAWQAQTIAIEGLRTDIQGMRGDLDRTRDRASEAAEDVAELRGALWGVPPTSERKGRS